MPAIFFARRLILCLVLVFKTENFIPQICVAFYISLALLTFINLAQPYESPYANRKELFNECIVMSLLYTLLTFTEAVPDPSTRYAFGWLYIAFVTVYIVVHVGELFLITLRSAKELINQRRRVCMWRKYLRGLSQRRKDDLARDV